jgi:FMN-dependent NADH-azoreductase
MSKLLYIKANPKNDEESRTFKISEAFINEYRHLNPKDEIITLDLYNEGIDFLTNDQVNMHVPRDKDLGQIPFYKYAIQFVGADKYVIAAPMWNLSIPAILKAYIDYIAITGITFKYTAEGAVGLCTGKNLIHISGRGGMYSSGPAADYEMGDRYLRSIFGFLGITDFRTIAAEMLDVIGQDINQIVADAIKQAKTEAAKF